MSAVGFVIALSSIFKDEPSRCRFGTITTCHVSSLSRTRSHQLSSCFVLFPAFSLPPSLCCRVFQHTVVCSLFFHPSAPPLPISFCSWLSSPCGYPPCKHETHQRADEYHHLVEHGRVCPLDGPVEVVLQRDAKSGRRQMRRAKEKRGLKVCCSGLNQIGRVLGGAWQKKKFPQIVAFPVIDALIHRQVIHVSSASHTHTLAHKKG